jgi:hypothetical protein
MDAFRDQIAYALFYKWSYVYVLYRHENVLVMGYKIFYKSLVQLYFKVINYVVYILRRQ